MASHNERISELDSLFSKQIDLTGPTIPVPRIMGSADLDAHLPDLCESIFRALSSQQCEATYQRCLALDLQEAGVSVAAEVSIALKYKGRSVGTRRADLVLETADASTFVLELKATATLTPDNLKQLEFYMHYLNINVGYQINFPHDSGFSDVSLNSGAGVGGCVFIQKVLSGTPGVLSDRSFRGKHEDAFVQIIKVERRRDYLFQKPPRNFDNLFGAGVIDPFDPPRGVGEEIIKTGRQRSAVPQSAQQKLGTLFMEARPMNFRTFGVTLKGQPCKICLKQGRFCSMHADQEA